MQYNAEFTKHNAQLCHAFSIGEMLRFRIQKICVKIQSQSLHAPSLILFRTILRYLFKFLAYETHQWKIFRTFFAQTPVFFTRLIEAYETTY